MLWHVATFWGRAKRFALFHRANVSPQSSHGTFIIGTSIALFLSVAFSANSALKFSQLMMSLSATLNILRSTAPVFGH